MGYTVFSKVTIGTEFYCNGTLYKKQSSRTANMVKINHCFYFGMNERVFTGVK